MDLTVAGGMESMTRAPFVMPKAGAAWLRMTGAHDTTIGWRFVNPPMQARYGTDSMSGTAQTLAREHAIHRVDQDSFALRSQALARTAAAQTSGRLAGEILPVTVPLGRGRAAEVVQDEHPARPRWRNWRAFGRSPAPTGRSQGARPAAGMTVRRR
ncbi:thiolase family protein [Paenirhodobacter populi]|uniref:thiolase family protein n=1 Tax=Paenirhodobacter populi TaxID=2306993 RepID=UPI001F4D9607|nr:hypothetical protein [Sinirhodobacter populi]